ncbi:MAG: LpqB family beta-propeller domain-containing protein [Gemmatimonadota bacterium]|nr:LpqB family beta-propeller domain-containing protein [Gemmatimonadota bacterium]
MRHPAVLVCVSLLGATSAAHAQLPRYGLSTRVENHMLPAVTSGPIDPDWHPDGSSVAYSMRGDIWIQRLGSADARAVTRGPGYHFEPAWSPDGQSLAFAVDTDGEMDIGLVRADGTGYTRLTGEAGVDVQPTWTPDGRYIVFASASGGGFDILRYELETGAIGPLVAGPGNQFQPAVSPDGATLAYISGVRGRLGSGGIWTVPMAGGEPTLVHYEETSYRPAPAWTPDGSALVFASDAAGSYDLATVPATGGNRVRLTAEPLDEFAPAISPDGERVAFVSNHEGPTALWVTSRFGDGHRSWQRIMPARLSPMYETATVRGRVVGPNGGTVPARIQLLAVDGRGYVPDGAFHRVSPANEIHYFHSSGEFEVTVPAGAVRVEALRGFEWIPADETVEAVAGRTVTVELRLERLADPGASRWVSGDTHVHDLHEGRYGITQQEFFDWQRADDLHVANDLIHMDGTKIMGRWSDLTGDAWAGSTDDYILRYTQEFRGSFGHVGLLGVDEFIMPLIGGATNTPYPADGLKLMYLDSIRALGGIGGFLHPYTPDSASASTPGRAAQSDIPIHALLGRGDFYDVVSIASDELASAEMYYHMLNVGVRLPATGGTDNFSNVWRDPSGGTARTYARLDGPLTWRNWIEAVRAGRTVATNGPLLFAMIDGREPGSELPPRSEVSIDIDLVSIAPVDVVQVIVDGSVAREIHVEDGGRRLEVSTTVPVEGARWVAVRARGGKARYSGDNYAFAHTTPVYFADTPPNEASRSSAGFLAQVIDEIWRRIDERNAWVRPGDRATYRSQLDEALRRLGAR